MMKEEKIQVNRISTVSSFLDIKDSIEELIKETINYNFSKQNIDSVFCQDVFLNAIHYIEDESAIIYVAIKENEVIGWIWCHPIKRINENRLHIAYLAVSETSRKLGIGKMLLETVEKYAKDNNYCGLDLLVSKDNIGAVSFYLNQDYIVERYLLKKDLI